MRFASRSLRISNEFKPTLFDSVVLKVPSLVVLGLTGKFGVHSRQVEIAATGFLFFLAWPNLPEDTCMDYCLADDYTIQE